MVEEDVVDKTVKDAMSDPFIPVKLAPYTTNIWDPTLRFVRFPE